MAGERDQIHVDADEARGGSTPHRIRWILAISLIGAIVLLSVVWMIGAASQTDEEDEASVSNMIQEDQEGSDTDGVLIDGFDETGASAADDPLNVPNQADDASTATQGTDAETAQ